MFTRYVIPFAAFVGFVFSVYVVMQGNRPVPAAEPVSPPPKAPYESFVAGAGIIEAQSENIAVSTAVPGLIMEVFQEVGNHVALGDPLFKLDGRSLQAQLKVQEAALQISQEKLQRLMNLPRPEDIPVAEARANAAEMQLKDAKDQLALMESVTDKRALSEDTLDRRRYAVRIADANLQEAKAQLSLLKAGSWEKDIAIAKMEVEAAQTQVNQTKTEIERLTVRAPIDGLVLQKNIRVGEYAQIGVLQTPMMVLGDVDPLHIRTDVDEHDAWRLRSDSPAFAYVRGNRSINTPLNFVRIEPYVVPKKSLTGQSTERVDTRVLQVIYSFEKGDLPVYVGQQMDVYIKAEPVAEGNISDATAGTISMN